MNLALDEIDRATRSYYRICWIPSCVFAVIYFFPVAGPFGVTPAGCVVIPSMIAISVYLLARGGYLIWWANRIGTSINGLLLATLLGSWPAILYLGVFIYGYFVLHVR